MKPNRIHSWNITPKEAEAIQLNLIDKVKLTPYNDLFRRVGATAALFDPNKNTVYASVVVVDYPTFNIIEQYGMSAEIRFPYISGMLAFREGGLLMKLFRSVKCSIDIILFHAHGQAHPRKFGLASHIGVLLDLPSIGFSEKILIGQYKKTGTNKNDISPIIYNSEEIGAALVTKHGEKPVFISAGHNTDTNSSVKVVKQLVTNYRQPEPIRLARLAAKNHMLGHNIERINDKGAGQTSLF